MPLISLGKLSDKITYKVVPTENADKESIDKVFEEYHAKQKEVSTSLQKDQPKRVILL